MHNDWLEGYIHAARLIKVNLTTIGWARSKGKVKEALRFRIEESIYHNPDAFLNGMTDATLDALN